MFKCLRNLLCINVFNNRSALFRFIFFSIQHLAGVSAHSLSSRATFWPLTSPSCPAAVHRGGDPFHFGHFWDSHIGQRLQSRDKLKHHRKREANLSAALFIESALAVTDRLQGTL